MDKHYYIDLYSENILEQYHKREDKNVRKSIICNKEKDRHTKIGGGDDR